MVEGSRERRMEMGESMIGKVVLAGALATLFDEGFHGAKGAGTWYVDNDPGCGLFGTLEALDAAAASQPLAPGDPLTAAAHADHVRFALNLANRAAAGENPYPTADWSRSFDARIVDEAEWKSLLASLRAEVASLRAVVASGRILEDETFATGAIGLISHTAWHLGALRQGLGLVRAPTARP